MKEPYGLVWFSKVTKEYSDMEINYNDYGLGCYNGISYTTTVNNLLPNVAYTFCVVVQNELTTSPFHCKSIHMGTNLIVSYSSWLTLDSRVKGICLVVFGIVLCTFLGIFVVILVLKRKPTLLKGSKRVASAKKNSKDIMVFPRDESVEQFKRKEQLIAKRNSKSTIISDNRRNSTDSMNSIDSNDSYMNVNLYEVIPAYIRFNENSAEKNMCNFYCGEDRPEFYLPPLEPSRDNTHVVSYAEIPYRRKRTSNDPLPEVPQNQTSLSLSLSLYEETTIDTESMSQALIMEAQV
ncbi:uncharacterized protein LOC119686005 [Teleopsis dalmanni]|uniref:uncharacterized protein LOC119686005 n=1 Tax=Teleopsis dalmanni TaxID=139649 RepID=UPI0018CF714A|nr:uncharacterized protein LOC119686005 [Teleopsis dalmanni]